MKAFWQASACPTAISATVGPACIPARDRARRLVSLCLPLRPASRGGTPWRCFLLRGCPCWLRYRADPTLFRVGINGFAACEGVGLYLSASGRARMSWWLGVG